jgi:hypothetical protein
MDYKNLTIKELRQTRDEIDSVIKEKEEEEKNIRKRNNEDNAKYAKENIKPGDRVSFKYKEATAEGIVQKLNEKTFTVAFSFGGEDKVLIRAYHLFINKILEKVA